MLTLVFVVPKRFSDSLLPEIPFLDSKNIIRKDGKEYVEEKIGSYIQVN